MIFTGGFSAPLFVIANGIEAMDAPAATLGGADETFTASSAFNGTLDTVRALIDAKCVDPKAQAGLDPWSTALTEFKAGNFAMMPQGCVEHCRFLDGRGVGFCICPDPVGEGQRCCSGPLRNRLVNERTIRKQGCCQRPLSSSSLNRKTCRSCLMQKRPIAPSRAAPAAPLP